MLWVLKEGGIMEAKGITCKIPLDLHERISEEMRESGRTVSQYMEMIIREHLEGGRNMSKTRTMAFQVSEELFRKIWDMDSVGDIATVTVHIKKIREKIEQNSAKPQYIETIWGVGYRFKV